MNPLVVLFVALRALLRNKLRTSLTMLGVIIGVGAVISMTVIGNGAKARVDEAFAQMGSHMLIVRSGGGHMGGMRGAAGSQASLTWGDLEAIRTQVPAARYVAPVLQTNAQVVAAGQNWSTTIQGTTPEFFVIRGWAPASGALLTHADVESGAKVAVLGETVATNLFGPYFDPVGQTIRIKNVPFLVVGLAARKGQNPWGMDYDDVVIIPQTTFRSKVQGGLGQFIPGGIQVGCDSGEATARAQTEIESLLRARHRIRPGTEDDFSVRNLSEMASAQQEGAQTMTLLLGGIALVSLIVGGIGIMNIMLVSVTERTREIGLRMAVGARPAHILTQFLAEATVLSVMGGTLGIGAGFGAGAYLAARFEWPVIWASDIAVVAIAFSAAVGIAFGLYPALKASRLDPITALRYE